MGHGAGFGLVAQKSSLTEITVKGPIGAHKKFGMFGGRENCSSKGQKRNWKWS